jgi:hypothetical protein
LVNGSIFPSIRRSVLRDLEAPAGSTFRRKPSFCYPEPGRALGHAGHVEGRIVREGRSLGSLLHAFVWGWCAAMIVTPALARNCRMNAWWCLAIAAALCTVALASDYRAMRDQRVELALTSFLSGVLLYSCFRSVLRNSLAGKIKRGNSWIFWKQIRR